MSSEILCSGLSAALSPCSVLRQVRVCTQRPEVSGLSDPGSLLYLRRTCVLEKAQGPESVRSNFQIYP